MKTTIAFLASLTVALAGCLAPDAETSTEDPSPEVALRVPVLGVPHSDGGPSSSPPICVQMLVADGLGEPCSTASDCQDNEWCADSCCDPVTHACFAVGMCAAKRSAGDHCDYYDGDRQCLSGVCDPLVDSCL